MHRAPVMSSNVKDVGYDVASRTLEVGFLNGRVYQYAGVPAHVARELVEAGSVGRYLATQVKGRYPYRQVG